MTFDTIISLLLIGGIGYMMFKGGGCCGSHGGHHKDKSDPDVENRNSGRTENES